MEIIAIEKQTFEQIKDRLILFAKEIRKLCTNERPKDKWLDNQDVCELLNISKRSLQSIVTVVNSHSLKSITNATTKYLMLRNY